MNNLRKKIKEIYKIVSELEKMFPGLRFTPDGRMVGSIGEAIAAAEYDVKPHKQANHPRTDGFVRGQEI